MANTTTSLSTLLSLSSTLQNLPVQKASQVSNEAKSTAAPLQSDSVSRFGPAFVLDLSPKGMAILNGDTTAQNTTAPVAAAADNS